MRFGSPRMFPQGRPDFALWAGFLAGPLAWFLQLEGVYSLTTRACGSGSRLVLHLATLACLALVAGGSWAAWRRWSAFGREWPSERDEGAVARARFVGVMGLLFGLLFSLVIVAQWVAIAVLDPCPP